jgi:biotin-dependent carboxylase-like uncharacterized protein
MGFIRIISPGVYTSLQDSGRPGMAFYAIPRSGALDQRSASLANTLVGNPPGTACLEMNYVSATLEFSKPAHIAVTGADMDFRLDGFAIPLNERITVPEGGRLSGGSARGLSRAYLAIKGKTDADSYYGSFASCMSSGLGLNGGKPFRKGMEIPWQFLNSPEEIFQTGITKESISDGSKINISKGPEFDFMSPDSIKSLFSEEFKLHRDANRMGAGLSGPKLRLEKHLKKSVPILPGFIQLTPAGQLIVILMEGQTTGGYPRIAYIKAAELYAFNQIPLGKAFTFKLQ